MTRAHPVGPAMAVAVAAVVAVFGGLAILGGRAEAESAAACPAAVALRGDARATAAVGEELLRRGLEIEVREECPALPVEVRVVGEGIHVEIAAAGRTVKRKLAGTRAAATVIESWARHDVAAPLLVPATGEADVAAAPAEAERAAAAPVAVSMAAAIPAGAPAVPAVAPVAVVASVAASGGGAGELTTVARAAALRRPGRFMLAIRPEAGVAFDASTSAGAAASGCVRVGAFCLGAAVRAHRSVAAPDDAGATQVERTAVDLVLLAEMPIRIGRATLAPGVTVGGGWLETTGIAGGSSGHSAGERVATRGARAGVQVSYSVPLARGVAFEAAGSFDAALATHDDPFVFIAQDTGCTTIVRLPGEPRAWVHAGFGVRVDL